MLHWNKGKSDEDLSKRKRRASRKKLPFWMKVGVILSVFFILVLVFSYGAVRAYLNGEIFREKTALSLGKNLGGEAEIESHAWSGWDLSATQFHFSEGKGVLKQARAEVIDLGIEIGSVRSDTWQIPHVDIMELELKLAAPDADYEPYLPEKPSGLAALLPYKTQLDTFEVAQAFTELDLKGKVYAFSEIQVKGQILGEGAYQLELLDGRINLPITHFENVEHVYSTLELDTEALHIRDARVKIFNDRPSKVDAKYDFKEELFSAAFSTTGVDIVPLLPSGWTIRASGLADVDATFSLGGENGETIYEGSIDLKNGRVAGVPVLDKLAEYTQNLSYRYLQLSTCKCEVSSVNGDLKLSRIDIEDKGKLAIKGEIEVTADQDIDGLLSVGIPEGLLAFIPGAETKVFLPGESGLLWAKVKLSGSLDNIQENLTAQLRNAAAERMLEMLPELGEEGFKLLTGESNGEGLPGQLGEAAKMLVEGRGEVKDVARHAFDAGTDIIGSALGLGSSNLKKGDWIKVQGMEIALSEKWERNKKYEGQSTKPFASLHQDEKLLAQLFVVKKSGTARAAIESSKSIASMQASELKSFFTEQEFIAFLFDDPAPINTSTEMQSRLYAAVQVSEGEVLLFKLTSAQKDTKFTRVILQDLVESIRLPQNKPKDLIDEVIPKVDPAGLLQDLLR